MARSTGVKTAELEEGAREEERISERSRRSGAVSAVLTGFAPTLLYNSIPSEVGRLMAKGFASRLCYVVDVLFTSPSSKAD